MKHDEATGGAESWPCSAMFFSGCVEIARFSGERNSNSRGNRRRRASGLENRSFLCIVPLLRVSNAKDTNESVAQLVEQRTLNWSAPVERLEVEPHHMLEHP